MPSAAAAEGGATDASAGRALRLRQLGTLISVLRVEGDVGIAAPRDGKEDASGTVPGKGVPDGTGNSTPPEEGTAAGSEGGIGGEGGVWEVNLSDAALVRRAAWAVRQYLGAPVGPTVDPKEQGEADALLEVAANSLIEVGTLKSFVSVSFQSHHCTSLLRACWAYRSWCKGCTYSTVLQYCR